MIIKDRTIQAENGKELKRIADGMRFGSSLTLGYTYYLGGKKLKEPLLELPEHYEEVESIDSIRERVINNIIAYDVSDNVNAFLFNGNKVWLDKATRVGLVNSTNLSLQSGIKTTTLWLGGQSYTLPCEVVLEALRKVELYALECYNVTEQHKQEVANLYGEEELLNYDVTKDYPKMVEIGGANE